jgi:hypothetical protein
VLLVIRRRTDTKTNNAMTVTVEVHQFDSRLKRGEKRRFCKVEIYLILDLIYFFFSCGLRYSADLEWAKAPLAKLYATDWWVVGSHDDNMMRVAPGWPPLADAAGNAGYCTCERG